MIRICASKTCPGRWASLRLWPRLRRTGTSKGLNIRRHFIARNTRAQTWRHDRGAPNRNWPPHAHRGSTVMFRFTIRDMLWLTILVGLALVWRQEHQDRQSKLQALNRFEVVAD